MLCWQLELREHTARRAVLRAGVIHPPRDPRALRHAAAVQSLMRAHFEEENARAALLLEQAAYAQVRR